MIYVRQTPHFHKAAAPLSNALSSLDGYDERVHAIAALKKLRLTAAAAANVNMETTALSVAGAILADDATNLDSIIEGQIAEAQAARMEEEKARTRLELIDAVDAHLGVELDTILRNGADKLLRHLNGAIQDAYDDTHSLGLADTQSAEEAIESGKAHAWKKMLQLRTTIFQIRDAQSEICLRLIGDEMLHQHLHTFGLLENYADMHPNWLLHARVGQHPDTEHLSAPWPTIDGKRVDPAAMHQWIMQHPEAKPWVPTVDELLNTRKREYAAATQIQAQAQ